MQQTSFSSKKRMENYDQSKTTDQLINGQKRTGMSPHSFPKPLTDLVDANSSLSSMSDGDITTFASNQEMNGRQLS